MLKIAQVLVWLGPSFGKTCVDVINILKTKPHWKKKTSAKKNKSQRPLFKYDVSGQWSGHITPAGSSEGCGRARHPFAELFEFDLFSQSWELNIYPGAPGEDEEAAQRLCQWLSAPNGIRALAPHRKAGSWPLE